MTNKKMANKKEVKAHQNEHSPFKIQSCLQGMDYPADKDAIVDHADSRDASEAVMDILKDIEDREYSTPADLMKEVGKFL